MKAAADGMQTLPTCVGLAALLAVRAAGAARVCNGVHKLRDQALLALLPLAKRQHLRADTIW